MSHTTLSNQRLLPDTKRFLPAEVGLLDIFFKCEVCGKHLVADEEEVGATINCPDCNSPMAVPEISSIGKCPRCQYWLKFSADMKGELVHCPTCYGKVRLPGRPYPETCPKCGVGWVPPLHHCQSCSHSLDDPAIPTLIPTDRPVQGLGAA